MATHENARTGVMLCGHGSRDTGAIEEFAAVAATLTQRLVPFETEYGFLEFSSPIIREGLDRLRTRGVCRILAVPCMLFAAGHVKNDIPSVLNTYAAQYPDTVIHYGRDLGLDMGLVRAAGEIISNALSITDSPEHTVPRYDTLLLTVGRGTSDPDANSNICKVARMLWEGLGFGWGEVAYSGVTFPLVRPALNHAIKLGFRRIVVFPYFLFTGVLVRRIYDHTDMVAAEHPNIEFVKVPYLNNHPMVIDALTQRAHDILDGNTAMNCQSCKYRGKILGFEGEVGLAQESHHHHVEGIDHGHSHTTHGNHHPYPHADHPLGPGSLTDGTAE